ncbi:MAG TPA: DciA family protein [Xylella taiwanensis]
MSNLKSNANSHSSFQTALEAVLNEKTISTFHRAIWLDKLDQQLRSQLPATLANQCRLANVNGKKLVFLVESPAWHTKLRLSESRLLDAARSIGLMATQVIIKTLPSPLPFTKEYLKQANRLVNAAIPKGLQEALRAL